MKQVNEKINIFKKICLIFAVVFVVLSFKNFAFAVSAEDSLHGPGLDQLGGVVGEAVDRAFQFECGYPGDGKVRDFICKMESFCWFCEPYAKIISIMQKVANNTYTAVIPGLIGLMTAGLAIWLVIKILGYVAVPKGKNPGEFYTDIGKMLFVVCIAAVILNMGSKAWEYSVSPLASAAFEYGNLAMGNETSAYCASAEGAVPQHEEYKNKLDTDEASNPVSVVGQRFTGDGAKTGGILQAINQKLMSTMAIGIVMMTSSMSSSMMCVPTTYIGLFIAGTVIVVFSFWLLMFIPLKLADVIFRLGIFLVLMPLFIFSWPFPLTKSYAVKGVKFLLSVMLTLLMFAIVVSLCTDLVVSTLQLPTNIGDNLSDNLKKLEEEYLFNLEKLLLSVAIVFFSVLVFGQIPSMVNRLTDTGYQGSGFEKQMRAMPRNIKNAAKGTYKAGGRVKKAIENKFSK